jgi:hypothetical protein
MSDAEKGWKLEIFSKGFFQLTGQAVFANANSFFALMRKEVYIVFLLFPHPGDHH